MKLYASAQTNDLDSQYELTQRLHSHYSTCMEVVTNNLVSPSMRESYKYRAKELIGQIDWLTDNVVEASTEIIKKSVSDVQEGITEINAKLATIQDWADALTVLNQILAIVDQSIAIAAGLMK